MTPRDKVNLPLTDTVTAEETCSELMHHYRRYNRQGMRCLTSHVSYDWKKDEADELLANVTARSNAVNRINERFSGDSNSLTAWINSLNKLRQ